MPIYEYRCRACGFQKEYLQRLNEAQHTKCPECGKKTLDKMVTAAGFQLKGTGWYATDFKNSGAKPKAKEPEKGKEKAAEGSTKEASAKESSAKESSSKESSTRESSSKESSSKESSSKESSKADSKSSAGASRVSS